MLCTNAALLGGPNAKSAKTNPWGLQEDKFSFWTCCSCFRKRHVVPVDFSKTNSPILPVKIISEKEEATQTQLESHQGTPTISKPSPIFSQLPPPSSSSESSGYFTPPAEHHLKESFDPESRLEEIDNSTVPEPNFEIIDSETSEGDPMPRQSSARSRESTGQGEETTPPISKRRTFTPIDQVDFVFISPTMKAKSEANLKSTLPDIPTRKNTNSAPPLNDSLMPYPFDESEISPMITSLPGSIASTENTPTKEAPSISPKRLSRRSGSVRAASVKRSPKPPEIRPISRPKEVLAQVLTQMESCDWETIMKGLNCLTLLAQNHPDIVEQQMHNTCIALAKCIRNLRSQVARTACMAAGEIFSSCKRGLDMELDELGTPLFQRTADTNKFLRCDANAALDQMTLNLSTPRVVALISTKGSSHQNPVVRAAATRLLSDIAMRIGPEKVYQLPKDTRDKFFTIGANGLLEGSFDLRNHAKALIGTLMSQPNFPKVLGDVVPQQIRRHISKTILAIKESMETEKK